MIAMMMKIETEDRKILKMSEVIEDSLKIEAYSEKITENDATTQLSNAVLFHCPKI